MPFATPAELESRLEQSDLAEGPALLALESATGEIVDAIGWPLLTHTAAITYRNWYVVRGLVLPALQVTEVGVTVDGVALLPLTHFSWTPGGVVSFTTGHVAVNAEVTYTAGYPTVPAGVRAVCLDLAAAGYDDPRRRKSYASGAVSETYTDGGTTEPVDPATDRRLDPYRLPSTP